MYSFGTTDNSSVDMSNPITRTSPESFLALYMAVSLMVIIIVIGCAGNVMVILAVRTTKKLQNVSNAFVVNLSVCDLVFVMVILPFNIYTYITHSWDLSPFLCKLIGFLGYTLTGTTIVTITLIAWNRYKLVVDPQNYSRTFSRLNIAIMLALAWVMPMLCLLPALVEKWGRFGFVAMMVTCNLLLDHDSQSFKLFLLIVRAAIPCMLILFYYIRIYRTTIASHKRVRQGRLLMNSVCRLDQMIQRKEMHLTKMMATIFIVFAISYFPCTVSSIVDWNTVLSKRFHMFCLITVYVGSAVNPLIYGLMNSQFRQAYQRILLCRCSHTTSLKRELKRKTPIHSPVLCKGIKQKRRFSSLLIKLQPDSLTSTPAGSPKSQIKTSKQRLNQSSLVTPLSKVLQGKDDYSNTLSAHSSIQRSSPDPEVQCNRYLHRTDTEKTCAGDCQIHQEMCSSEDNFTL